MYFLYVFICLGLYVSPVHKHYVSKCFINYNTSSQTYQVSLQLFVDDVEKVLRLESGEPMYLLTYRETSEADAHLYEYLTHHLQIRPDDQQLTWHYLGKEKGLSFESMWVYMESSSAELSDSVWIHNSLLLKHFEDQKNWVDFSIDGKGRSSLVFSKALQEDQLSTDES